MSIFGYLKSSILSKFVMAVTGIMLVLYVVIHTAGNLLIFLGADAINSYSQFLHSLGPLLWIVRIVLLVAAILHIWTSISLKLDNMGAKPDKYAVKKYIKAKLTTRTMFWTGSAILLFVVYHISHLTLGITNPEHVTPKEIYMPHNLAEGAVLSLERINVFRMVVLGFRNPLISIIYIIAVTIVAFHLNHAVQSMCQTLGWNNPTYFPKIQALSIALSFIVAICLISIPISILLGIVGGNV